jgi:hypothetical protein
MSTIADVINFNGRGFYEIRGRFFGSNAEKRNTGGRGFFQPGNAAVEHRGAAG